jgi:hypothetical protein
MKNSLILLVLFAFPASAAEPPATTALGRSAAAIDNPQIGVRVDPGGPIAIGSGSIVPAASTAVRQLLCEGKPCGFYVAGPADFTFEVQDPFSIPVAVSNLAEVAPKVPGELGDGKLVISERLQEAVVWRLGLEAPALQTTLAGPSGLPAWMADVHDRPFFRRAGTLLLAAAGGGSPEASYAVLRGQHATLGWRWDPYYAGFESLKVYRIDKTYIGVDNDRYFSFDVARQPIGRKWWQRFPDPLVATARRLEVDNPEGETLAVKSHVELRATRDGVWLWDAGLAEQAYEGNRKFPLEVRSVKVDGQEADWTHRDGQLLVRLPRPLKTGEKVAIDAEYGGRLALRPGGDSLWVFGDFPSSGLAGELASLEMTVCAKAPFVPIAAGQVLSRESRDGFNTVRTKIDGPAQFTLVAAGKYELTDETRDGTTVHVATYTFARKDGVKRVLNNFFAAKQFYEQLFGLPYPYKELTILEIPEWGWGQAPPGMILLTQEAYSTSGSAMGRMASSELNLRFLHEVAHGYWGHVARMDSLEEQWITEAFAEYSSGLALKAMYGGEKGDKAFADALGGWAGMGAGGSVYLANYFSFDEWVDQSNRYLLLYYKGAAVIHAIREQLQRDLGSADAGDRAFIAFLRTILKSFPDGWAYTQHYPAILAQLSKSDWQGFFEKYVYGSENPPVGTSLKPGKKNK